MEYEKEKVILDFNSSEKKFQLVNSIISTRNELKKAHKNFDFAEDDLVDFYSYQIKALQSKLDYLTRIAKINNIEFNYYDKKVV